ncbi:hypothetical protein, partial [Mesorhizobium sp.]|uniref:hypothetical protein n=1 Tax=Mesorhizobium sp. TaxID=1871066 RepID=UPI0025BFB2BF
DLDVADDAGGEFADAFEAIHGQFPFDCEAADCAGLRVVLMGGLGTGCFCDGAADLLARFAE